MVEIQDRVPSADLQRDGVTRVAEVRITRQANLHRLVDQYANGNVAKYCDQNGWNYDSIRRVHAGDNAMGSRMARQIEERHGLNPGWMDDDHSKAPPDIVPGGRSESALRLAQQIEQLNVEEREALEGVLRILQRRKNNTDTSKAKKVKKPTRK